MKENEFDISIRNLMQDAEETVSPKVWEGISTGLDRAPRKRVVPLWMWRGLAGTAVAAAVAAAVILIHPEAADSNQPIIQPTTALTVAEAPENAPAAEETAVAPIEEQVSRLEGRTAYVPEPLPVVERPEGDPPLLQEEIVPEEVAAPTVSAEPQAREMVTGDEEAFNQLAFQERRAIRNGSLSFAINGNLQGNNRPETPTTARRKAPSFLMPAAEDGTGIRENPEFSFGLPISVGLGIRYDFTTRWGIGTGLTYTNLSRSFVGTYSEVEKGRRTRFEPNTDIDNLQHYLGIPLNVYYHFINTGQWDAHVFAGGTFERLIDNHYLIHGADGDIHYHEQVVGLQTSLGLGIGTEFRLTPYLGIYFDPSLRYYFDTGQPRSIRTIQPLRFDFEIGVRFTLRP